MTEPVPSPEPVPAPPALPCAFLRRDRLPCAESATCGVTLLVEGSEAAWLNACEVHGAFLAGLTRRTLSTRMDDLP